MQENAYHVQIIHGTTTNEIYCIYGVSSIICNVNQIAIDDKYTTTCNETTNTPDIFPLYSAVLTLYLCLYCDDITKHIP